MKVTITYRSSKEILDAAEAGTRTRLSFDYLDDLSPHLPIEEVVEVYRKAFLTTTVKPVVVDGMLPLWLHGHVTGDTRISRAALAPLRDCDISWGWPLFEAARARFRELDLWPERWMPFKEQALDRRRTLRDPMADLLDQWLWRRIVARRNAAKIGHDSLFYRWGWDLTAPFENNLRLVSGMESRVALTDGDTYPPFFPGDESEIRLRHRAA